MNGLRAVTAALLNASQRSRVGVEMNRSTSGRSVKRCGRSYGLDAALYKNIHFKFLDQFSANSRLKCFFIAKKCTHCVCAILQYFRRKGGLLKPPL